MSCSRRLFTLARLDQFLGQVLGIRQVLGRQMVHDQRVRRSRCARGETLELVDHRARIDKPLVAEIAPRNKIDGLRRKSARVRFELFNRFFLVVVLERGFERTLDDPHDPLADDKADDQTQAEPQKRPEQMLAEIFEVFPEGHAALPEQVVFLQEGH